VAAGNLDANLLAIFSISSFYLSSPPHSKLPQGGNIDKLFFEISKADLIGI
jgi:hypothetical protein